MVKPSRKFSFSDTCPQFFKVYLADQSSQQLRIPPAFVKNFNGVIPSKSTITNHGSRSWRVELNMVDKNLYFQNGWHKFVHDNSLEYGDFLIFYYGGNSMFYVKIFGKNACLKEVSIPTRKSIQKQLKIRHTVFQENQTFKPCKHEQSTLNDSGKQITKRTLGSRSRALRTIEENDGASKAAAEFVSEYPFFQVVIKPTYAQPTGYLNIPSSFFKKYMEKGEGNAILHISAKSWPVSVKTYMNRIARFSKGWKAFVKDNTLKAGDVCVFELIERDDFRLKTSILRG
ncbi:B3 domain-containing transcription factor VRN1-like [Cornus florida]|uniref:B3 domain-containing transcription factor VRN1-like n=1 Tax=Cornus florida TaxID=4283 RepID=UPI002897BBFA|nr:B3 domain-containing transcription factor VRN1-like [Cornus florida]